MLRKLQSYWQNLKETGFIPLLNLLLGIFYLRLAVEYFYPGKMDFYPYLIVLTLGITSLANLHVFYHTLSSKSLRKNYKNAIIVLLLSVSIFLWYISLFAIRNPPPLLILVWPVSMVIILFITRKHIFSSLLIRMMAITILLTLSIFTIEIFEGIYCWKQGKEADPSGTAIAEPTEEERKSGLSWTSIASRTRNDCHKNFNVFSAMKDELIPR